MMTISQISTTAGELVSTLNWPLALAVFLTAFALCAIILFSQWLSDGWHWMRGKPRNPNLLLGMDMRGRAAVIEEISACRQFGKVRIAGEIWNAKFTGRTIPTNIGDEVKITGLEGLTLMANPGPQKHQFVHRQSKH